jgi:hypothetical protein
LIRLLATLACFFALVSPLSVQADNPPPPARAQRFAPGGLGRAAEVIAGVSGAASPAAPAEANPVDAWSRVAFQSYRTGNWEIFSMRPDGSDLRQLTSHPASDGRPEQSRADGRIVFISSRTGDYEIYSMAPDGSQLRQLTNRPGEDNYPTWSPDGKRIAWAADEGEDWNIYVMNADGSGVVPFANTPDVEFGPAWSPDNQWIAWVRLEEQGARLWIAHPDGSAAHPVTSSLTFVENVAWSPDSQRIAFDYTYGQLYFMRVGYVPVDSDWQRWPSYIYEPSQDLTDALLSGWSPDGREILFALASYTVQQGELVLSGAQLFRHPWNGSFNPPVPLPGAGSDMLGDWQRTDFTPPTSRFLPFPRLAGPEGVVVEWIGSDSGGSGLLEYDFQVRSDGTAWTPWNYLSEPTSEFIGGLPGERRYFRLRARDAAGNVEPWPASPDGDGSILFYKQRYQGSVLDARHGPVGGAKIEGIYDPAAPFLSAPSGGYDAFAFHDIYQLNATAPGFASPPAAPTLHDGTPQKDFILTDPAEAVKNGGFEDDLANWQVAPGSWVRVAGLGDGGVRSGQRGLLVGYDNAQITHAVSQSVAVPAASLNPTLTFVMRPYMMTSNLDRAGASISVDGKPAVALTLNRAPVSNGWTHAWADLTPWAGKQAVVSIELRLQNNTEPLAAFFDEISVAPWRTPRITSVDAPDALPGVITVHGDNFEQGAVVSVADTPLPTTFVDAQTLTAEAGKNTPVGPRILWVANPGGQRAGAEINLGAPLFLPFVSMDN